jgi:hypothetical protein
VKRRDLSFKMCVSLGTPGDTFLADGQRASRGVNIRDLAEIILGTRTTLEDTQALHRDEK